MSELAIFQPILKSKQEEAKLAEDAVVMEAFTEDTSEHSILPRPKRIEAFVSEDDTKRVMRSVFTAVGLMIGAMFIAFLFIWSYNKEKTLFIAIYSAFMFIFSVLIIAVISIIRKKIDDVVVFYILVGSSAFFAILNLVLILTFTIVASKRLRRSYVPSGVQEYINP